MIIFINGVLISPVTVCLCASGIESRDHIFCYFAINKAMWGTYFCRVSVPTRSRINWICHFSACDRLRCKVWRVAWYAVICHVLRECNMYVNGVLCILPMCFVRFFRLRLLFITLSGLRLLLWGSKMTLLLGTSFLDFLCLVFGYVRFLVFCGICLCFDFRPWGSLFLAIEHIC